MGIEQVEEIRDIADTSGGDWNFHLDSKPQTNWVYASNSKSYKGEPESLIRGPVSF